ncbi:ParB N-terminal domain-containing protein [Zobellia nedashkovskayae]
MAKATKKQALGRGLSALLKSPENDIQSAADKNADKVVGNIVELDIEAIEMNPFQPRSNFNDETLKELATSIGQLGVIQPITVRKLDFNKYQLVSGERRCRASKLAGLTTIPAYIRIADRSRIVGNGLGGEYSTSRLRPYRNCYFIPEVT